VEYLENLVFEYLKARPNRFLSAKEIGRDVVDRNTYRDNPLVAKKPLSDLAARGLIKTDPMGHFGYKPRALGAQGISCNR
jgi:hypothetical protein